LYNLQEPEQTGVSSRPAPSEMAKPFINEMAQPVADAVADAVATPLADAVADAVANAVADAMATPLADAVAKAGEAAKLVHVAAEGPETLDVEVSDQVPQSRELQALEQLLDYSNPAGTSRKVEEEREYRVTKVTNS